jgi:hypothetical protein
VRRYSARMETPSTVRWTGDVVIVRHFPGRNVAERIWAQIGRVTGTIIRTGGSEPPVDEGPTGRGRQIRNECTERSATLPVTSCGAAARPFCDRCVACDTSPRGRIADLTMTAFVELGGNLEDGCFNATLRTAG